MIQNEFKRGSLEDKYLKIETLTEILHNYLRNKKSVGMINYHPDTKIYEFAEPVGTVLGITNCTGSGAVEIGILNFEISFK